MWKNNHCSLRIQLENTFRILNKALARGNQETELISTMNNYAEIGNRVGAGNGEPIADVRAGHPSGYANMPMLGS